MPHKYKTKEFPVERVREQFDYDYETGFLISKNRAHAGKPIKGYCCDRVWQVQLHREDGSRVTTNYGRVVFAWHHERWPDREIDHLDRDPRNNRIENLREAGRVLQSQNRGCFKYGSTWFKRDSKWKAQISINGKHKHLGYYETQKEAQEAFMRACDDIGKQYLPATLVDGRYVPAERVMGIR